jgi:hypothetical protein
VNGNPKSPISKWFSQLETSILNHFDARWTITNHQSTDKIQLFPLEMHPNGQPLLGCWPLLSFQVGKLKGELVDRIALAIDPVVSFLLPSYNEHSIQFYV